MGLKQLKAMAKQGNYQDMAAQITELMTWTDSLKKLSINEETSFENGEMKFRVIRIL